MLKLSDDTRIYIASEAVDFRKSIDGLAALVLDEFESTANNGSAYVFYSRDLKRVKCLFWDKNGYVLYHKRLEVGRFKFCKESQSYSITSQQLGWLFAGLDFKLMGKFPMLDYSILV